MFFLRFRKLTSLRHLCTSFGYGRSFAAWHRLNLDIFARCVLIKFLNIFGRLFSCLENLFLQSSELPLHIHSFVVAEEWILYLTLLVGFD